MRFHTGKRQKESYNDNSMADTDNNPSKLTPLLHQTSPSQPMAKPSHPRVQVQKEEVILDSLSNPKFNILMFLPSN